MTEPTKDKLESVKANLKGVKSLIDEGGNAGIEINWNHWLYDQLDEALTTLQELETDIADELRGKERREESLRKIGNKLYQERFNLYTALAPKLGFKPFGKGQITWAKSQEQADAIRLGESVFKYVEQALPQPPK